jgi:hypothetical protein
MSMMADLARAQSSPTTSPSSPTSSARSHGPNVFASDYLFEEGGIGGFGGPEFKFTLVNEQPSALLGGRGGFVIDRAVSVGFGAFGLVNGPEADVRISGEKPSIGLGYAGAVIEAIFFADHVVHGTVGILAGGGAATYQFDTERLEDREDGIFVLDSFAGLELNVTRGIRLNTGVGWRQTFGVELRGLSDRDVAGLTVHLILKLGHI